MAFGMTMFFSPVLSLHKAKIRHLYGEAYPNRGQEKAKLLSSLIDAPTITGVTCHLDDVFAGFILAQQSYASGDIIEIITTPSFRRRGIASGLLDAVTSLLQNNQIPELFLEVSADNYGAQALYIKNGFNSVGKRDRYYRRKDHFVDAIVMKKSL